jgi:UDP-glucose 4-epimerase
VHRCDLVYRLAAAVGSRLIVDQPVHTITTNIRGTETMGVSRLHAHRRR